MKPRLFLTTWPLARAGGGMVSEPLVLDDERLCHYVTTVLRMQVGQVAEVLDGHGYVQDAVITAIGRRSLSFETIPPLRYEPASEPLIVLGAALMQGDKTEWVLEKAVELGVHEIVVLAAERSKVKLDSSRAAKRLSHWQSLIAAAAAQCGRTTLPQVSGPVDARTWLGQVPLGTQTQHLFWDPTAETTAMTHLQHLAAQAPQRLVCASGPESGWSPSELAMAAQHWQLLRLGPRVLRAETAPLAGLTLIQAVCGDWRDS